MPDLSASNFEVGNLQHPQVKEAGPPSIDKAVEEEKVASAIRKDPDRSLSARKPKTILIENAELKRQGKQESLKKTKAESEAANAPARRR